MALAVGGTVKHKHLHLRTESIIRHARLCLAIAVALSIALSARSAAADQLYNIAGNDQYRIGDAEQATVIAYAGSQELTIVQDGHTKLYRAEVHYTRSDHSGAADAQASFVQVLAPDGSLEDRSDNDPDFLTVLNQPFAVELDPGTLRDIARLQSPVPFQASSPVGSATLHGTLRPGPRGPINGHPAIGIAFEADGPMSGNLPQHAGTTIAGTIRMDGIAYYAARSALLLALDATLTITGKIQDHANAVPVHIIYRRTIRANDTDMPWGSAKR